MRRPSDTPRILQPDTYKDRMSKMWEGRGRDYDSRDTFHRALAERLVEFAEPGPSQVILDVATGTGMVSIPLAERVGDGGRVIGIDISQSMLEVAGRKARDLGMGNLELRQADAEEVEFGEGSFDSILCSSAMICLQHTHSALQRFLNWLKPGGKLCFNTPQEPCVLATSVFYSILAERVGLQLADAAAPLATEGKVAELCRACGFASVSVSKSEEVLLYSGSSPEDYAYKVWRAVAENAIMTPLEGDVSGEDLAAIKPLYTEKVVEMAKGWVVPDGIAKPYTTLWVRATK